MPTGTVKFFNTEKGYGSIAPDGGGADIFVHVSELERSGIRSLNEGQKVRFETKMDPKKNKPNATNISVRWSTASLRSHPEADRSIAPARSQRGRAAACSPRSMHAA